MGKRSTGKKRGIQRGVAKHKIRSKPLKGKEGEQTVLGIGESVYFAIARKCFEFWFYWCGKLYLAPFARTATGEYVPLDPRSKLIHYVVWSLKFLMQLHKLGGLGVMLWHGELRIETFMCTSHFLIYLTSFSISIGMIARTKETIDLLNSWPYILSCLRELRKDVPSPFDDLSAALKIIAVLVATQGIAFAAALLTLAFSTLPTCYFPAAEYLGLIPDGMLPRFAWQLIFFPLEYLTYIPPMLCSPLCGSMLLIFVGVLRTVGNELRSIKITDMDVRAKMEHLYICHELYNRVCYVWVKFMLPPTIFGVSLTIIVTTFISIRYTELPFMYYIFFANTAFTLMLIIFWLSYDLVLITRDSEDIMSQLLSYEAQHLRHMSKRERTEVMKRAKAMRVIEFPIGEFADFAISVPVAIWEEILNQVLFLLEL